MSVTVFWLYFTGHIRLALIQCEERLHKDTKTIRRQRSIGRPLGRLDTVLSLFYSTREGKLVLKMQTRRPCTKSLQWTQGSG